MWFDVNNNKDVDLKSTGCKSEEVYLEMIRCIVRLKCVQSVKLKINTL